MRLTLALTLLALTLATLAVATPASAADPTCIGKPGTVQACAGVAPTGTCAGVSFGLQGAFACVGSQGPVRVCTSAYTALYGYCPTDLIR